MTTIENLMAQRKELDKQIAAARDKRVVVIRSIQETMAREGISYSMLLKSDPTSQKAKKARRKQAVYNVRPADVVAWRNANGATYIEAARHFNIAASTAFRYCASLRSQRG